MKQFLLLAAAFLLLAGCNSSPEEAAKAAPGPSAAAAPAQPVSGRSSESVYQLPDTFQTQDHEPFLLPELAGKPTVLAIVFTNCGYACPRLTDDMKAIEAKLAASAGQVNYVLVSFDVARDTAKQLKWLRHRKRPGQQLGAAPRLSRSHAHPIGAAECAV